MSSFVYYSCFFDITTSKALSILLLWHLKCPHRGTNKHIFYSVLFYSTSDRSLLASVSTELCPTNIRGRFREATEQAAELSARRQRTISLMKIRLHVFIKAQHPGCRL